MEKWMDKYQDGGRIDNPRVSVPDVYSFMEQYTNSPNFSKLARRMGDTDEMIEQRRKDINSFNPQRDIKYIEHGRSDVGDDPVFKMRLSMDRGDWRSQEDIVAHEFGHLGFNSGDLEMPWKSRNQIANKNWENQNYLNQTRSGETPYKKIENIQHDVDPNETRADLFQLRYQLKKHGIYDSSKDGEFTEEHFNKFRKTKDWNRLQRLYKGKDIIWLMNNIAQNKQEAQPIQTAQDGGFLGTTNKGRNYSPAWGGQFQNGGKKTYKGKPLQEVNIYGAQDAETDRHLNEMTGKESIYIPWGSFKWSIRTKPEIITKVGDKISFDHDIYDEVWQDWAKSGKPNIRYDEGSIFSRLAESKEGVPSWYNPFTNTINMSRPVIQKRLKGEGYAIVPSPVYLHEQKHAEQAKDDPLFLAKILYQLAKAGIQGKDVYETKGTLENEASDTEFKKHRAHVEMLRDTERKTHGGTVSKEKAKEILRDGTAHGHPLTPKQKRYFGWIAGGKKEDGGWLNKYSEDPYWESGKATPKALKERLDVGKSPTEEQSEYIDSTKKLVEIDPKTNTPVYEVDGSFVRQHLYPDFTEGGNDGAYPAFIPKREVWIDRDSVGENRFTTIAHELLERNEMVNQNKPYLNKAETKGAHIDALNKEHEVRKEQGLQNGGEIRYYQNGLDFKPKTISQDGSIVAKNDVTYMAPVVDPHRVADIEREMDERNFNYDEYISQAKKYLSRPQFKNTPVKPEDIAGASHDFYNRTGFKMPLNFMLTHMQMESGAGADLTTANNLFNIGNTSEGKRRKFESPREALDTYLELMYNNYLDKGGKSPEDLLKPNAFVNSGGYRYAKDPEYEKKMKRQLKFVDNFLKKDKEGGVVKDNLGYLNPDNFGKVVEIDSPNITMQGVDRELVGVSDEGEAKLLQPGKNYKFKGKKVREYPIAKYGINELHELTDFTNRPRNERWLNKYS